MGKILLKGPKWDPSSTGGIWKCILKVPLPHGSFGQKTVVFVVRKLEVGQNPVVKPNLLRLPEHKLKKIEEESQCFATWIFSEQEKGTRVSDEVITSLVY